MNRRKFAHSWGRKLFFGLSWPLSLALGSIYLSSFIVPKGPLDWIYFVLTYVGHFGLLNALVYFFLFAPVVTLMPSYYITRLWSLLLILALNSFIAIDGLTFAQYHTHVYNYLWPIFLSSKEYIFTNVLYQIVFIVVALAVGIYIWVRGEFHWRFMQGRFSNPIKNWYIVLIIIFVGVSKALFHWMDVAPRLGMILPLDYNYVLKSEVNILDTQKFADPFSDMKCNPNEKSNLVLLLINEWTPEKFNEELMPHMTHFKEHVVSFENHLNVNENVKESEFTLTHALPGSYTFALGESKGAFFEEAEKNGYNILSATPSELNLKDLILSTRETSKPFILKINSSAEEADTLIYEMVIELQKKNFLDKTHIVVTGINANPGRIPFLYSAPEGNSAVVESLSSHYDILPSFMKTDWNCKKLPEIQGVEKDWYLVAHPIGYKIYDLTNGGNFNYDGKKLTTTGKPRQELIFKSLKIMNQFLKP